jgi:hypothetical protein
MMVEFACFLIRNTLVPVPGYDVHLHETPFKEMWTLHGLLAEGTENDIRNQLHRFFFALLVCVSDEALSTQWKDPLMQFVIAHHLIDDAGTFTHVTLIPPNLAKIQWCLRATAAWEILLRKPIQGHCLP